jgi:nucleotide-binding universal stress UspA family protein
LIVMKTRIGHKSSGPLSLPAFPKRILVPVDFSPCSLGALRHALKLSRLSRSEIVLVHVVEPSHSGSLLETSELRQIRGLALQEAEHRLAELARTKVKPHAPVKHLVRPGKPFPVITDLARKTAADLIVLGTHGHTGLSEMLLGSTAERVTRGAHCPVLIVRELKEKKSKSAPSSAAPPVP